MVIEKVLAADYSFLRLEELQVELKERLDKQRFDIINQKTPKRMLIGEDDGTEEENRDSTTAAKEG